MRFDEVLYNDEVLDALDAMNFQECTPIQELAIPIAERGSDLIAVAQTGTGKTAAYLLPVIDQLADGGFPQDAVNCVVMAPTRELVQQIDQQMQGFSYFLPGISSTAIYGGTDGKTFDQQKRGLTMGADVVIATPGRLIAHLQMGYVDLSQVSFFILDEADRMLDKGFFDDIMKVVSYLPKDRQTLMFSATMHPKIQKLAQQILTDPEEIKLAVSKPAEKIRQTAYVCYERQKEALLLSLFKATPPDRVIVFASSKLKVKQLARALRGRHMAVEEMHSDLDQSRREEVMLGFKAGRVKILVATDIVSRGIDIDDISLVVNFDVPHEAEDYVHRVGRTARAERDGQAITFIGEKEQSRFRQIEQLIEREVEKGEVPAELGSTPSYGGGSSRRSSGSRGRKDRGGRDRSGKSRKNRSPRATQEPKNSQGPKSTGESHESRDSRGSRKSRNSRNSRNHRNPRNNSKPGQSSGNQENKQ